MEIVAGAVVVTTLCAAGFVTLRGAGAAAEIMTTMFQSPANLGWPPGVQEDDDYHWQWSAVRTAAEADDEVTATFLNTFLPDPPPMPELVDLPYGAGPRPSPVVRV
jgi:hypothetical protein